MHTSRCFRHRPNTGQGFAGWTPAPFTALGSGKILQLFLTFAAVNTPLGLGAVPKTTAPLANFQLHAQFHDEFSVFLRFPEGLALTCCSLGVERTGHGRSGFLCPDGGWPLVFSRYLSCSWRADPGITPGGCSQTLLVSVLGWDEKAGRFSSSGNCSLATERDKKPSGSGDRQ